MTRLMLISSVVLGLACSSTPPANLDGGTGGGSAAGGGAGGGSAGGGTADAGTASLTLTPAASYVIADADAGSPATTLAFTATLTRDGVPSDVTSSAVFSVSDPTTGSFSGPTFTAAATLGARTSASVTVSATAQGVTGTTPLLVVAVRLTGDSRDVVFTAPFDAGVSPAVTVLKTTGNIQLLDVALVVDTGNVSAAELANAIGEINTTLVPAIQTAVPGVQLAVAEVRDFPVVPYGVSSDFPVRVAQLGTADFPSVQMAVSGLSAGTGGDQPGSQLAAMTHVLNGAALDWGAGMLAAHSPPSGTFGGVDFRSGAVPVVVLFSNNGWHDTANQPYSGFTAPTSSTVAGAFLGAGGRFINVTSGSETQADALSDSSKSNLPPAALGNSCPTGVSGATRSATGPGSTCRLNFLQSNGAGFSTGVVKALQGIAVGSVYDVTYRLSNGTPGGFDATPWFTVRAMTGGNSAAGCPAASSRDTDGDGVQDTFTAVVVGSPSCFEITPVAIGQRPAGAAAQAGDVLFEVIGMPGNVRLDRRHLLVVVPSAR